MDECFLPKDELIFFITQFWHGNQNISSFSWDSNFLQFLLQFRHFFSLSDWEIKTDKDYYRYYRYLLLFFIEKIQNDICYLFLKCMNFIYFFRFYFLYFFKNMFLSFLHFIFQLFARPNLKRLGKCDWYQCWPFQ